MMHALKFVGVAVFYIMAGTVFASLIAWSMILIVSAGAVLIPSFGAMIGDPAKIFQPGTGILLGGVALSLIAIGSIGYVVAPFVGAWIGWKSAVAISLVMALVWHRSETRRHAMHAAPIIGALGALLTPPPGFGGPGSAGLVWVGIAVSSLLSALIVTLIVRSWLECKDPA